MNTKTYGSCLTVCFWDTLILAELSEKEGHGSALAGYGLQVETRKIDARNPFQDAKTSSSQSTAHVNERHMQRSAVDQEAPPIFWRDRKSSIFWSTRANARSCTLALSFG